MVTTAMAVSSLFVVRFDRGRAGVFRLPPWCPGGRPRRADSREAALRNRATAGQVPERPRAPRTRPWTREFGPRGADLARSEA